MKKMVMWFVHDPQFLAGNFLGTYLGFQDHRQDKLVHMMLVQGWVHMVLVPVLVVYISGRVHMVLVQGNHMVVVRVFQHMRLHTFRQIQIDYCFLHIPYNGIFCICHHNLQPYNIDSLQIRNMCLKNHSDHNKVSHVVFLSHNL